MCPRNSVLIQRAGDDAEGSPPCCARLVLDERTSPDRIALHELLLEINKTVDALTARKLELHVGARLPLDYDHNATRNRTLTRNTAGQLERAMVVADSTHVDDEGVQSGTSSSPDELELELELDPPSDRSKAAAEYDFRGTPQIEVAEALENISHVIRAVQLKRTHLLATLVATCGRQKNTSTCEEKSGCAWTVDRETPSKWFGKLRAQGSCSIARDLKPSSAVAFHSNQKTVAVRKSIQKRLGVLKSQPWLDEEEDEEIEYLEKLDEELENFNDLLNGILSKLKNNSSEFMREGMLLRMLRELNDELDRDEEIVFEPDDALLDAIAGAKVVPFKRTH